MSWNPCPDAKGIETPTGWSIRPNHKTCWNPCPDAKGIETRLYFPTADNPM